MDTRDSLVNVVFRTLSHILGGILPITAFTIVNVIFYGHLNIIMFGVKFKILQITAFNFVIVVVYGRLIIIIYVFAL